MLICGDAHTHRQKHTHRFRLRMLFCGDTRRERIRVCVRARECLCVSGRAHRCGIMNVDRSESRLGTLLLLARTHRGSGSPVAHMHAKRALIKI